MMKTKTFAGPPDLNRLLLGPLFQTLSCCFVHFTLFFFLCVAVYLPPSVHLWFVCDGNLTNGKQSTPLPLDHTQSSYRVSSDGSFLVSLASGMELSLSTEPLLPGIIGGGVSPTASRCNISLPGDHAPSLIEWRQRKEQSKTNYSTYERRLRVKHHLFPHLMKQISPQFCILGPQNNLIVFRKELNLFCNIITLFPLTPEMSLMTY